MAAPQVFDRALLRRRLARAQAGGYAGFLLEATAADLGERLSAVVRPFSLALDCGSPGPNGFRVLQRRAEMAIRLAPSPEPGTVLGDEDEPGLDANVFLKRTIASSGLVVLPRTGHAVNLEEPDHFNALVEDFFSTVERGRWMQRDPRANIGGQILGMGKSS